MLICLRVSPSVRSVEDSEGDCPEDYWDEPSKRCAHALVADLEQARPDDQWTSPPALNRTCGQVSSLAI